MAAERFLAALDDLRGTGTVTVAVAHSGVTVDALRALPRRRSAPCNTSSALPSGVCCRVAAVCAGVQNGWRG